jgi:hypothetical protein
MIAFEYGITGYFPGIEDGGRTERGQGSTWLLLWIVLYKASDWDRPARTCDLAISHYEVSLRIENAFN